MKIRFLQSSDWHIGSKLYAGKLGLPADKVLQRRKEIAQIPAKIVELAKKEKVELLLLPGDLWDTAAQPKQTALVIDTLAQLAPIPVLIISGNHDPYNPNQGPFGINWLNAVLQKKLPANIKVFTKPTWEVQRFESFAVWGMATLSDGMNSHSLFNEKPEPIPNLINILMLHASYAKSPGLYQNDWITYPFTANDIESLGMDYVAAGHYHRYQEILSSSAQLLGAYAGSPVIRDTGEIGDHCILIGEMNSELTDSKVTLERHYIDPRNICTLEINLWKSTNDEIKNSIETQLATLNASENDIVYIKLKGSTIGNPDYLSPISNDFNHRYFHIKIDASECHQYHDIDKMLKIESPRLLKDRFVQALYRKKPQDENSQEYKIWELALQYGLDALSEIPIEVKDVV